MMVWAILFAVLVIVALMTLNNAGRVPWANKMRRVNAAAVNKAEWMAPDEVVQQVKRNYLDAINWLHDSMFSSWTQQWSGAAGYLIGAHLKRHQQVLLRGRAARVSEIAGVMRCDHVLEVRHFGENGDQCLIVDYQTGRRMATYNRDTHERLHTQDLGDGVVVYRMKYDEKAHRWKIEQFVQELPAGWGQARRGIKELTTLPMSTGRDS